MTRTREEQTLRYEEHSAEFWSTRLGAYGGDVSARAGRLVLVAAVVSALAGVVVWTTLSSSAEPWAQLVVTALAVSAALLASWPAQLGHTTCATHAARLSDDYARALVLLREAHDHLDAGRPGAAHELERAERAFEHARSGKEALRPYPKQLQAELEARRAELAITTPSRARPPRF